MAAQFLERIQSQLYRSKVVDPADLIKYFSNGQSLGWSGFTSVGYPKVLPSTLAQHVQKNNLQGKMRFNLFVGASVGRDAEDKWAELDMIDRRWPFQVGPHIQKGINSGRIRFGDKHLSMFPQDLMYGFYTKDSEGNSRPLDIGIIEATAILPDGGIIPGASVGASPEIAAMANKLIIEVNTGIPNLEGLHDIYLPIAPPNTVPIPLTKVDQRIGTKAIYVDPSKVVGVVHSHQLDRTPNSEEADGVASQISHHLLDFFNFEVRHNRLPPNLLPLQSGIGQVANAIIKGLTDGPFTGVSVWTEVVQDSFLDFFDNGKLLHASTTSIHLSPAGFQRFYNNLAHYAPKLTLRPQQIANNPEMIRRLGCIAMNTPVEFDIYGHANSTCVSGSRMLNGIGGSGDFLRNSKLSIMHTPSARKSARDPTGISCVVPMVSHVDQTEHDLDVFVTEQGLADLRGLSPKERAKEIIDKCAHPDYKPMLRDYLARATKECLAKGAGHEPHMLRSVFKMYTNLEANGTMKVDNWD